MRWLKSRINNIPTTNCVQLGIENYIWIWWYNYSILMLFMPITGSNLSYEKHMRMKVEREGPTLKLTPLNTCLSPNDLWTSLHSMSTSWSSSIWPFKSLLLDKVELSCRLSILPKPGLLAAKTGSRPVCHLLNGMSPILQKEEMEWITTAS